jgi:hypothetical protein
MTKTFRYDISALIQMGDELYPSVQEKNFVSMARDRTKPPNFCTNVSPTCY